MSARPRLLAPTALTLAMLALLLGLGSWQVQRLHWKEALIAERDGRLAARPVALPALSPATPPEALDDLAFRRVAVRGRFLHQAELLLVAPALSGAAGYHVITPLERSDGGVVLVSRGWIPYHLEAPESRAQGQVEGQVRIAGIARATSRQGLFVPDNSPETGLWYWRDLGGMAAHLGLEAPPLLIEAGPAPNPGGYPLGGQTRIELKNDHLGYAITWYALAAALVGVYLLYLRQARKEARKEAGGER
jgi:surfeit locus 1 family protein